MAMTLEFMSGGSLNNRLWNTPLSSVSWDEKVVWARDAAEGMAFIHTKGFVHRDLKTQNLLYDIQTGSCKVADFGMSRSLEGSSAASFETATMAAPSESAAVEFLTTTVGTPQYMGPEMIANQVGGEIASRSIKSNIANKKVRRMLCRIIAEINDQQEPCSLPIIVIN